MESNMRTMLAASAGTFDGLANGMVLRHGSYSSHGAASVHSPAAVAEAANGGEGFDVGPMARCENSLVQNRGGTTPQRQEL